ncbi:alpha/beta fold hydrolase [Mycobacterium sp. SP-6446]|uniref:alpha/beta fold hydrolase n=1 Tax=Mycobacterium sp. SP-6446 TaxID=1834162 RepID=UPI0020C9BE82|nr:alpha/beta fold hydrolase [Mycobacterium sp. SP-6446]
MEPRGCVLVLPGGKARSEEASRWWQLANVRMMLVAKALRRRLGPDVEVRRVQAGPIPPAIPILDALRDAKHVLDAVRNRFEPKSIVLVGHSMGGRVAAHLAGGADVGAVVALAPWWVGGDGELIPPATRLLVLHGTADTWTDPGASRTQTLRAGERGLAAQWVGVEGAGHYMVRRWAEWHRRTVDFVADYLRR